MATRLTPSDRQVILDLLATGTPYHEITARTGRSMSTISALARATLIPRTLDAQASQETKTLDTPPSQEPEHPELDDPIGRLLAECPRVLGPAHPPRSAGPADAVVMLDISDVHMGSETRPEDVGGLAVYDRVTYEHRMDRLVSGVGSIVEAQRGTGQALDTIYLNVLGDLCDGESIYPGHGRDIDAFSLAQVTQLGDRWVTHLYPALLELGFKRIIANCVPGNHGRMGRKGDNHPMSNLDMFVYLWWRQRLADIPQVEINISSSPWLAYELYGRIHYLTHGDTMRSWAGIPYYGLQRLHERAQMLLDLPVWAVHAGHHHRPVHVPLPNGGFLSLNGCWPGGSDFSINRLSSGGIPRQTLRIIDRQRCVMTAEVDLDDPVQIARHEGVLTPTL